MSDRKQHYIDALREERRGYMQRGLDERVKQVDEALRNLGAVEPKERGSRQERQSTATKAPGRKAD